MSSKTRHASGVGTGSDLRYFGGTEILSQLNAFVGDLSRVEYRRTRGDLEQLSQEIEFLDIYDELLSSSPLFAPVSPLQEGIGFDESISEEEDEEDERFE